MTIQELELEVRKLGFTFSIHQSMGGSQYIKVDSIQFRISDHYQPSHYQIRNYTDVSSFEEIIKIVSEPNFNENPVQIIERDGVKYSIVWNDDLDDFVETKTQ